MRQSFFILSVILILSTIFSCSQDKDKLFFVFLNTNPHKKELPEKKENELQQGHQENIKKLHKAGTLLAAGPFLDKGGIFILRENSLATVKKLLKTDPAINARRYILEYYPLEINIGEILPVGEKYQMGSFQAFRFFSTSYKMGFNASLDIHNKYLKSLPEQDSLLFAGHFGRGNDFWLLYQEENDSLANELFANHPLVKDSTWQFQQRQLHIARETFIQGGNN